MGKYSLIIQNTWNEFFSYRLNFLIWRVRWVLQILTLFFIWSAILGTKSNIFGYDASKMLTYILGGSIVSAFVWSSRSYQIGDDINNGDLSNYLMKPINFIVYYLFVDLGDKTMNLFFSVVEVSILFIVLKPPFFIQTNINYLSLFLISILIALCISFLFNVVLGFLGFWSPEVWAPRFIFNIILSFFAGTYFPIDILPRPIASFFSFLPFQYTLYFPLKVYLGQLSGVEIFKGIMIGAGWLVALLLFANYMWSKGLKTYTAYGR